MIQGQRVRRLNGGEVEQGGYVLYWMQGAQRAEYNHALEYAVRRANDLGVPVLVCFGIMDSYPSANLRHYDFMLRGLRETQAALEKRKIKLVIRHLSPEIAVGELAKDACCVVVDDGHTRVQREWRNKAAETIESLLEEVETNVIVPACQASEKENYAAKTIRPRINKKLGKYLQKLTHKTPAKSSLNFKIDSFDISDIDAAILKLDIDKSVAASKYYKPGTAMAKRVLRDFIKNKLDDYEDCRNDPCIDGTSDMSPYLHFGQISPVYIALEVMKTDSPGKDAYLEELIVRRELAQNFVYYNDKYDRFDCLPPWAKNTLNFHGRDKRAFTYSLEEFENAQTHDPYWNAAQKEMMITGKMHGYMRMYWGKKILEWSKNHKKAYQYAVYLNDKYELDGRDPNSYAGVAWCFGKHDRPWKEREIFGKVRYMNDKGLKRKFDPDKYDEKIEQLEKGVSKEKQ